MKDFNAKWWTIARQARLAPAWDCSAPYGFAARIASIASSRTRDLGENIWDRMLGQVLAGTLAFLAICAVLELPKFKDRDPLNPGVEKTVAQLLWRI